MGSNEAGERRAERKQHSCLPQMDWFARVHTLMQVRTHWLAHTYSTEVHHYITLASSGEGACREDRPESKAKQMIAVFFFFFFHAAAVTRELCDVTLKRLLLLQHGFCRCEGVTFTGTPLYSLGGVRSSNRWIGTAYSGVNDCQSLFLLGL